MNRTIFLRALAKQFYPTLRAAGFVGSGSTLRRINGPVVHVFNVQGSTYGQVFYINLGATLTFLNMNGVDETTAGTVRESQCVFHYRLASRGDENRQWQYGATQEAAEFEADDVGAAWKLQGQDWFRRYANYPDDFRALLFADDTVDAHPAHLLVLASIAQHAGEHNRALVLGRDALARCPEAATNLRRNLTLLVNGLGAA